MNMQSVNWVILTNTRWAISDVKRKYSDAMKAKASEKPNDKNDLEMSHAHSSYSSTMKRLMELWKPAKGNS